MQVEFLRVASEECADAVAFYESQREGLGSRLLDSIERGVEQITSAPETWPKVSERSRRYRLRRFPYGLVYQIREQTILIIAVMHLHRRPNYWQGRERE
jgi:mRNA-degrading endonuclease RelE of RelBE toxin-antitoxin system